MNNYVSGIGGIFFRAEDHKTLAAWYEKNFGINVVGNDVWTQEAGATVFAPFKKDTGYFGRKEQQFMINFRVKDLDGFVKQLESSGVRIDPDRQNESYGKFAWVYDPEGNKIELWEPLDEEKLKG